MAKVTIENKVDSTEKLAAISGKPSENYLLADEFNQVKDLANKNGVKATSWEAGTIFTEPTCVIKDNLLYVLNEAVTFPFTSTDFNAEITAGNWIAVFSEASSGDNYFTYESAGFKVNVTAGLVNIWLRNNQYVQYDLYFDESTGITDKSLIIPDVRSVVYKVPEDCFLEELSTRRPPSGNGKILIWKTASDSVSSTPIEILYKLIDNTFAAGGQMGSVFYGENIPLLKGEYLHFFFTTDIGSQWWNKIFIRFKKQ